MHRVSGTANDTARQRVSVLAAALLVFAVAGLAGCAAGSRSESVALYAKTATELGIDCDAVFRETERRPTVSVVRVLHGPRACEPADAQWLALAVFLDLARARGFEYWVVLSGQLPAGGGASAWVEEQEYVLGFLRDPGADLAAAFPEYVTTSSRPRVLPTDAAKLARIPDRNR